MSGIVDIALSARRGFNTISGPRSTSTLSIAFLSLSGIGNTRTPVTRRTLNTSELFPNVSGIVVVASLTTHVICRLAQMGTFMGSYRNRLAILVSIMERWWFFISRHIVIKLVPFAFFAALDIDSILLFFDNALKAFVNNCSPTLCSGSRCALLWFVVVW